MTSEKKHPQGRPKASENWSEERFYDFGAFRATHETMAEILGVSTRTIEREMANDESPFCRAYKKGLGELKDRISQAQVREALKGNPTLLVWLGKQYLGQKDKQDIEHSGEIKTTQVLVQAATKEDAKSDN